ncbi:MAG: alpha-hydroxy-acid oxidizing protein [Cyanobacteria bacterium REEB67]|nr:alpha-hydroxy-acid oxidizing protein [Cyanobacteria bacterium REEB67]
MAYDYYASGATDEITLKRNRQVYSEILLRPKMLCDVSYRDLSVKLLGQTIAMPILVAPTAFQGLAHKDAELATARAARSVNTIMTVSTLANSSLEEVAAEAPQHLWFQLYVYKDREITKELVGRAAAAGYKALVVTVDSPILGKRERDLRNGFHLPAHLSAKNLSGQGLDEIGSSEKNSGLAAYIASLYDTALTWEMLDWIMSIARLPVLVKGILRGEDAKEAMSRGAAGVIVSNHGGRQIDTTVSTIEVLPEIVAAMEGRGEILIDGGIRRGTDVLKALALGAKAVLVGRPILWALATGGEAGVKECLTILRQELDLTMALSGCATLAEITPDLLKLPLHMK